MIDGRWPFPHVQHKQNQVRLIDRQAALLLHPSPQLALRRDFVSIFAEHQPGRVDDDKPAPAPLAFGIEAVTRQPRQRVDDGSTLAQDAVEEGGFSDVGAADDRHERQRHQSGRGVINICVVAQTARRKLKPIIGTVSDGRVVLKENRIMMVSDEMGDIPAGNTKGLGLYFSDTRFVSTYEFRLNRLQPILLSASVDESYVATFQMVNPVLLLDEGKRRIPQ